MRRAAFALALAAVFSGCGDAPEPACIAQGPRPACAPGDAPIRRLTRREYVNTVRDLLGALDYDTTAIEGLVQLVADPAVEGFEDDASAQTPSPLLVEQYGLTAARIAGAVLGNAETLAGCAPRTNAEERACGERFVRDFGEHAFRRPITAEEAGRFDAFFEAERSAHGFDAAISAFVEGTLQSPSFLYRPEFGQPGCGASEPVPLTGWEMASRLSYLIWASMPDDPLLDAAARGELAEASQIAAQVHRMLADPRAHDGVAELARQWLELSVLDGIYKDKTTFPSFVLPDSTLMKDATVRWVDHWFWDEGGTLPALFTDTHAYADPWLAGVYGAPAPGGDDLALVDLDPTQRSGFLTQAGLLSALAHPNVTSPVKRGVYVLDVLLCQPPAPPPPGVSTSISMDPGGGPQTVRQHFEQHASGSCQGCHAAIDGIGFGFEQYDAMGQWQTTDNGLPVDASGNVVSGADSGPFHGAVELSHRLANSRAVRVCVARKWFHHGFGRIDAAGDACTLSSLQASLDASGGDLRELFVAIATSDAFRYRGGGSR